MITGALGQSTVGATPAPAVAGDFASANPKSFFPAGPGGLVAGTGGVTVGLAAWIVPAPVDADGAGQQVLNSGNLGGYPAGIIPRVQQGLITQYLDNADMGIPAGFQLEVMTGGDIWVKNDGSVAAAPGMKAYVDNSNGKFAFAASGAPGTGGSSNSASIAAGSATMTASISGNVMTVTGTGGGAIVIGGTIGGAAGSAGGDAVPVGTQIVSLLSGTLGAANSTYLVSGPPMNVTSTTIVEVYGILTVGGTITGTFTVGDRLSGTGGGGVTTDSFIVSLGTGSGGAGTYNVNKSQTVTATTIAAANNLETKWVAQSAALPGDLVKISANEVG
jgi:hypothetical protein